MLKLEERQVLLIKYMKLGLDFEESVKKVKDFNILLLKIRLKLEKRKKTPEQISQMFRKEFEKLCQKLEV